MARVKRTPLARGAGPARRTPLKPRSDKTRKRYEEERVPFVIAMLAKYPICYVALHPEIVLPGPPCQRQATDVHEVLSRGRSGGVHGDDWLKEENVRTLCRACHSTLTDHPALAESYGLLKR